MKKDLNDINNFKEDITKIEEISSVSAFTDLLPRLVDAYPGNQSLNIADNPKFNSKHIDKYVDHLDEAKNEPDFLKNASRIVSKDLKTVRFSGRMFDIKAQEAKEMKERIQE